MTKGTSQKSGKAVARSSVGIRQETGIRAGKEFQGIFENLPVGVVVMDKSGRLMDANRCFCDRLGWHREKLRRMNIADLVHLEDRPRLESAVMNRRGLKSDELEIRFLNSDNLVTWGYFSCFYSFSKAGAVYTAALVSEMLPPVQRHLNLNENEALFQTLAFEMPAYLWITDGAGSGAFFNKAFIDFTGCTPEELAEDGARYVHPDDLPRVRSLFNDCFRTGAEFSCVFRARRHDGVYRWIHSKAIAKFSSSGVIKGYRGVLEDITDLKHAQLQLEFANENLQSEFASGRIIEAELLQLSQSLIQAQELERVKLARELHDSLGQEVAALSIHFSQLKKASASRSKKVIEETNRIQERLQRLAHGIRSLSHELHPAVLKHSPLEVAIAALCEEYGRLNGMDVKVAVSAVRQSNNQEVAIAVSRITHEALANIRLHSETRSATVTLTQDDSNLILEIADQGKGFDPGLLAHNGLGLISIRERARLLGGNLLIQSAKGSGTVLTVTIPLA